MIKRRFHRLGGDSKLIKASEFSKELLGMISYNVYDEWTWKNFNFKKRPKRGLLFQRFVSERRQARERFIAREIAVLTISAGIQSLCSHDSKELCRKTGELAVRRLFASKGIVGALDFFSTHEAEEFFFKGLDEYDYNGVDTYSDVFFNRAKRYTESHFDSAWLISIIRLTTDYNSSLLYMQRYIKEHYTEELVDDIG